MPDAAARPKNVLLIVVDQWRADCLSYLGHPCLRTPNLDALCADGVTFRNHFTQAVPCGPGRASLHTGLYMMNHRVAQNSVPMDARHTNLALEMRRAGYEPGLVGYTTTTPDPRVTPPEDPRFRNLGALMPGWYPVGPWEPEKAHYFNWLRDRGFPLPEAPEDIWLPADGPGAGPTRSPSRVPTELSDSAWATECALTYLRGMRGRPWCLHLGYYRPHPPFIASAPYHALYDPAEVPRARARGLARGGRAPAPAPRLLHGRDQAVEVLPRRPRPRLGDDRGRGADDARGVLRADHRGGRLRGPGARVPARDRPVRRHPHRARPATTASSSATITCSASSATSTRASASR